MDQPFLSKVMSFGQKPPPNLCFRRSIPRGFPLVRVLHSTMLRS